MLRQSFTSSGGFGDWLIAVRASLAKQLRLTFYTV